jgi:aspartyl-tRNA(Asn)/glutamyl-tRNA(Gln) amidotransferase subunit A
MAFEYLSITQASSMIQRGDLSPVELTQSLLARIEQLNPLLNAFITITAEQALVEARQAESEIKQGNWKGPLHGIPLALKDLYDTTGVPTTAGSTFFRQRVPDQDAAVVQKLRQAGMVLLGKLNLHEIALGVTNENPHYGDCHNPWDPACITGGSSGGSGAALAAGLCLGSLGSDTGGSIRIPSSLCGVVGLKPTYGRSSLRGVIPLSWNLDHVGPMGRRVRDAALLLQAIAGYDPADPYSANVPVDDYLVELNNGVRGWRIAVAQGEYFQESDEPVLKMVEDAAHVFAGLGAQVEHVEIPDIRQVAHANGLMVTSDAAAFHHQRLQENPQGFGADVLKRLQGGAAVTSNEYILARRTQTLARRQFEKFFGQYDVLLLPAAVMPAPRIGSTNAVERARQLTRFTAPFNLTGLPAISVPGGFTPGENGHSMPLGLQIVAGPWSEARLLRAAYAFEQEVGYWKLHP